MEKIRKLIHRVDMEDIGKLKTMISEKQHNFGTYSNYSNFMETSNCFKRTKIFSH